MHGSALGHVNRALFLNKSPPPPKSSFIWVVKNAPSTLNGSRAGINLTVQPDKFKSKPLPEVCPYSKYKVNEFKVV